MVISIAILNHQRVDHLRPMCYKPNFPYVQSMKGLMNTGYNFQQVGSWTPVGLWRVGQHHRQSKILAFHVDLRLGLGFSSVNLDSLQFPVMMGWAIWCCICSCLLNCICKIIKLAEWLISVWTCLPFVFAPRSTTTTGMLARAWRASAGALAGKWVFDGMQRWL